MNQTKRDPDAGTEEELLPRHTTVDFYPEKVKGGFMVQPSTRLYSSPDHFCARESPRKNGPCHTVLSCLLVVAVLTGFAMLYWQMSKLEQEVQRLKELTDHDDILGPFDVESDWSIPTGTSVDRHNEEEHYERRNGTRERRSIADDNPLYRRTTRTVGRGSISHVTAHVVPYNRDSTEQLHTSAWFEWTRDPQFAHTTQISLRHRTHLVVPHSGYYLIYSQITVRNPQPTSGWIGHGLWVKSDCGSASEQKLIYSSTTQTNHVSLPRDSNYLSGVFYLQQYDHIGVRPEVTYGRVRGTFFRTTENSYFGMVLLSHSAAPPPCQRPIIGF